MYEGADVAVIQLRYRGCTGMHVATFTFYADMARKATSLSVGDEVYVFFDFDAIPGKRYNHLVSRNIEPCEE